MLFKKTQTLALRNFIKTIIKRKEKYQFLSNCSSSLVSRRAIILLIKCMKVFQRNKDIRMYKRVLKEKASSYRLLNTYNKIFKFFKKNQALKKDQREKILKLENLLIKNNFQRFSQQSLESSLNRKIFTQQTNIAQDYYSHLLLRSSFGMIENYRKFKKERKFKDFNLINGISIQTKKKVTLKFLHKALRKINKCTRKSISTKFLYSLIVKGQLKSVFRNAKLFLDSRNSGLQKFKNKNDLIKIQKFFSSFSLISKFSVF